MNWVSRPISIAATLAFYLNAIAAPGLTDEREEPAERKEDALLLAGKYAAVPNGKDSHGKAAWAFAQYHLLPNRNVISVAEAAHKSGEYLATYVLLSAHRTGTVVLRDKQLAARMNFELREKLDKLAGPTPLQLFVLSQCGPGDKDGRTIAKNPDDVFKATNQRRRRQYDCLKKAANAGCAQAIFELALGYERRDPKAALDHFERAAKLGLAAAQRYAGLYLTLGKGRKDLKAGHKYSVQATESQDVYAMINLAMFANRGIGGEQDTAACHRWLEKAVATGHPKALMEMGMAYLIGEYGYTKNRKKGLELWQKAVVVADGDTLAFLGHAYDAGFGVDKDAARALAFMEAAYRQGADQAAALLARYYGRRGEDAAHLAQFWSREASKPGFGLMLMGKEGREAFEKRIKAIKPFALKVK